MYYKKRKMEAQNQLIFNRIVQLPVPKAITDKALSTYEAVKNHNRLFNFTIQLTENVVKYASETAPAKFVLESRVASAGNQIAVQALDHVENKYPIVKKTPEELWNDGENYYNESSVKPKVDTVLAIKNYGVSKVTGVKNYWQGVVTKTLDGVLDYTESLVDRYVGHGDQNGQVTSDGNASYINRVTCISGKIYYGTKHQVVQYYNGSIFKPVGDMVIGVADYGITKITNTKNAIKNMITGTIDGVLDFTDAIIDKYIIHAEANGQTEGAGKDASYFKRVNHTVGKLYYGSKYRATDAMNTATTYALEIIGSKQHKH